MSDTSHPGLRLLWGSLFVLLTACHAGSPRSSSAATEGLHVRVLATHDLHGALRPTRYDWSNDRPIGGAAGLKSAMDRLETGCACPTIRVDSGDQMQGMLESNLNFGASVVATFSHLGLDAAAVGNHDLDWGVDTLLTRQAEARYPWLAANVFRVDDGNRPAWATPFTIVERGGARIGIIGYVTVSTPRTLRPEITEPYEFRAGYAGIRDALDAVWLERPDFVIIAAHAGGQCTADGCAGEMVELAGELPPGSVHLIAGGHTHAPGEGVIQAIPIVRAGSSGRAVAVVDLYRLDGSYTFEISRHTVYADDAVDDPALDDLLATSLAAADALGQAPVATLAQPLSASATGDRRLGYLMADAVRRSADADIGMHNPGGVRADLPRGLISYTDVYRVMPFDNAVVRIEVTGRQLRELVEQAGVQYYFSNLTIGYAPGASTGDHITSVSFSDATAIEDDESYALATSDFLAEGGDGFAILRALPRTVVGITVLDAVLDYLQALPTPVELPIEQRESQVRD